VIHELLAAARECDAALIVSTHDPVVADQLHERWHLTDGRLTPDPASHAVEVPSCSS
jgi:ABC-type lipoprotein export system ATPase subunit